MTPCACNSSLSNTGRPNCVPIFMAAYGIFAVPTYDSEGNLNSIDLEDDIDEAYLTARLNDTDATKRWYPIMELKNVTSDRSDPIYETFPDNSKAFVQDGVRTFSAEVRGIGAGPEFKQKLDSLRCSPVSIFVIDKNGSIRGIVDKDSEAFLYPIKTDPNTWLTKLIPGTDTTNEHLLMNFDWAQSEDDALLRMIDSGDMEANLLGARGLVDVNIVVGAITTTTVVITLSYDYGSLKNKLPDSGLVANDFVSFDGGALAKVYNSTDDADIAITSVVENPNGTYLITWGVAQTVADVMKIKIVKNGRDYSGVNGTQFVIPA